MTTIAEKLAASKAAAEAKDPSTDNKEPKVAGYISMRLKRFVNNKGVFVYPNEDGTFVPKTQEEYDALEHYADANMNYVARTPE